MRDNVVRFDNDTNDIVEANKVKSLLAVNTETGLPGAVQFEMLVNEAGKRVGDAVKVTGDVLPTLGDANKYAEIYGGASGRALTYNGNAVGTVNPFYDARLFWDGTLKTWEIVDQQERRKGENGASLSQLWSSTKQGGYAFNEKVRDANYFEYTSLANSNTAPLTDITKWKITGNSLVNAYINIAGNATYPVFKRNLSNASLIDVTLPNAVIELYSNNGIRLATSQSTQNNTTLTISTGNCLYWNIPSNEILTAGINVVKDKNCVVLAVNRNGVIIDGLWKNYYLEYRFGLDANDYIIDDGNSGVVFTKDDIRNNIIKVTLPSALNLVLYSTKTGKALATSSVEQRGETFSLSINSGLFWDIQTNTIKIGSLSQYTQNMVTLLYNKGNDLVHGYFESRYQNYISASILNGSYIDIAGNVPMFTFRRNRTNQNLIVKLPNYAMYLYSRKGQQLKISNSAQNGQEFEIQAQNILIWNLDTNVIEVINQGHTRNVNSVLLADNRFGFVLNGFAKPWFDAFRNSEYKNLTEQNRPENVDVKVSIKKSGVIAQSLTAVNNEMWVFTASDDSNVNTANILRYNINTWEQLTSIAHNLGHCASSHYNILTDTIMVGNGSGSGTNLPRVDLILNTSSYIGSTSQSVVKGSSNVLSIPLFTESKQIGGAGLICCFGEDPKTIYFMTSPTSNMWATLWKGYLGMGANDFSDKTADQSSLDNWGTFISGRGANEYNGILKIVKKYIGNLAGTYQGMTCKDGYIWLAEGYGQARIHKIKIYNDGIFRFEDMIDLTPTSSTGAFLNSEPEGICIDGHYLYSVILHNPAGIIAVPIYGTQGGEGVTDFRVLLDFPTPNPKVQITPLTSVTDLYIESIDSYGFTVKSATGATGKFNWSCHV